MIRAIRSPDIMWYVEYWDDENDNDFPIGTAYVLEYQDGNERKAIMSFVIIADHKRRQGVATKLLADCKKRWPGIKMSEPTSESGKSFRDARRRKV